MMKLSINESKILIAIYKSVNGLDRFYLFKKSRLGFSDFYKEMASLISNEFVYEKELKLYLTDAGRSEVQNNMSSFLINGNKEWRKIPDRYIGDKISPNSFYIPSRSRMS